MRLGWDLQGWKAADCNSPAGPVVQQPHGDVLVPVCCPASRPDEPARGTAALPGCSSTGRPRGSRGPRRSQSEFIPPLLGREPQARCCFSPALPITWWVSLFLAPGTGSCASPQLQLRPQEQTLFGESGGNRYSWCVAIRSWGCAHLQPLHGVPAWSSNEQGVRTAGRLCPVGDDGGRGCTERWCAQQLRKSSSWPCRVTCAPASQSRSLSQGCAQHGGGRL